MERGLLQYLFDFCYATLRFHNGFTKPLSTIGYFAEDKDGALQKQLFDLLRKEGFRRTPVQLVFPGQTAALVKTVRNSEKREYHVRFYDDGTIECEEEVGRFRSLHYQGERIFDAAILEEILERSDIKEKKEISDLFGNKQFSDDCVRSEGY